MIEFLIQPWPWWFSGSMIALIMLALLIAGGEFGVSSNLRTFCSIAGAGNQLDFFNFNWKSQIWNIIFILGIGVGGFLTHKFLNTNIPLQISTETTNNLALYNISTENGLLPTSIFNFNSLFSLKGVLFLVVGGFLVGLGSRYAGGCTSGHAISGLSNLQLPSLIAVIGFFIGGLIMTWIILPQILSL